MTFEEAVEKHERYLSHRWQFWNRVEFKNVDFAGREIRNVDFSYADFRGADLRSAKFIVCKFHKADFRGAMLSGAKVYDDSFSEFSFLLADLDCRLVQSEFDECLGLYGCVISEKVHPVVDFYGYKRVYCRYGDSYCHAVAKLLIPASGRNIVYPGGKCRCDKAYVISITDDHGNEYDMGISYNQRDFFYYVGDWAFPDYYDDSAEECSHGIHFFLSEKEAWDY